MTFFRRPAVAWVLFLIWAGAIWYGSTLSLGAESPFRFFGVDKLGHAAEFGILGVLAANALLTRRCISAGGNSERKIFWLSLLMAGGWGLVDEVHQIWVPGRTTDPLDLVADIAGASIGAWLLMRWIAPALQDTERRNDAGVEG